MAFNDLTAAEDERLALLMEECGEVLQIIGKIMRHGYSSSHPAGGPMNRVLLMQELGDLRMAVQLMIDFRDVDEIAIGKRCVEKWRSVEQYLHHQGKVFAHLRDLRTGDKS